VKKEILVERFSENPLLTPADVGWVRKNYPKKDWGVLNCGVIFDKKGSHYKMLFRGGAGAFADIGLAVSEDGVTWQAEEKPVLKHSDNNFWNGYCERGIEDPRIVEWIDEWYYIFATACSEKDPVTRVAGRVGIWRTRNFLDWEWVGIPFDQEDKDASIFPEPINGWAYLIHRKAPHIWISRTRDMLLKTGWKDSQILSKDWYKSPVTGNAPEKNGIAGPPIRTPKGWLVITHIVHGKGENRFNRVYSLSFMVLNLDNPTKIEYQHPAPILWPTEKYEMDGCVPVVCFSNATVDHQEDFLEIFYGGADTVIAGGRLYKKDLPMCY